MIAANEATCIYVLPGVFAEYKKQFPGVQLQVNRSYGSRVVEAVMENVADFGLTQLPVAEKRVQIVDIYRDEIRCVVPAGHPLASADKVAAEDILPYFAASPAVRHYAHATEFPGSKKWKMTFRRLRANLDSTETMKRFVMAGLGISFLSSATAQEEVTAGLLDRSPWPPSRWCASSA